MIEEFENFIKQNIKCCACGGTLETSKVLNILVTKKIATWKYHIFGVLDCPGYPPKAMAFVCDECRKNEVKIRHCIEFEVSTGQVTYHDVDSLEDINEASCKMKYYFGKKLEEISAVRNKLMLKAARERSVN